MKESEADVELREAMMQAQALLENMFNGNDFNVVKDAAATFAKAISHDDEIGNIIRQWREVITNVMQDASYMDDEVNRDEVNDLMNRTSYCMTEKYSTEARNFSSSVTDFVGGASEDETNIEFVNSLKQLVNDLFLDANGNLTIKSELAMDLAKLLPAFSEKISYVPLPRFEHDDEDFHVVLDDMVLKFTGLLPGQIQVMMKAALNMNEGNTANVVATLGMMISQVQLSARNVYFEFTKKTGFPRYADSGRMSFDIYRNGVSFDLVFVPSVEIDATSASTNKQLLLQRCNIGIDKLRLSLTNTKHDFLYRLCHYSIEKMLKKQLARAIEKNLRDMINARIHHPQTGGTDAS
jgi:hypothetical protein